jgi:hypothetical protein
MSDPALRWSRSKAIIIFYYEISSRSFRLSPYLYLLYIKYVSLSIYRLMCMVYLYTKFCMSSGSLVIDIILRAKLKFAQSSFDFMFYVNITSTKVAYF